MLTTEGFFIKKSLLLEKLGEENVEKLFKKLTIISEQKIGPPKITKLYSDIEVGKKEFYHLPRNIYYKLRDFFPDVKINLSRGHKIDVKFTGELFDNQKVVLEMLERNLFGQPHASMVLNMKAGQGKTFIAAAAIAKAKLSTLYVVPTSYLQKQTIIELRGVLSGVNVQAYEKAKKQKVKENKESKKPTGKKVARKITTKKETKKQIKIDVCVVIINTAMKWSSDEFEKYGLIIYDEVHMYAAEKRAEVFWKSQVAYNLGLSATTDQRRDGGDFVYRMCVGNVIYAKELQGYVEPKNEFNGEVKAIKYYGADEYVGLCYQEKTGEIFTPDMIKQLIADESRNKMILDELIKLKQDPKRQVYIFGETRDHMMHLASEFAKLCKNEDEIAFDEGGVMIGGVKGEKLDNCVSRRFIFTTYGYSAVGVSIPKMNTLVLATPRKSGFLQIIGRILRKGGDTKIKRLVIDIIDWRTMFRYQFGSRSSSYEFYDFPIKFEFRGVKQKKEYHDDEDE